MEKQYEGRYENCGGGGYYSPEKELESCSFVKCILMLLVVLYHSCAFWTGNWFSVKTPVTEAHAIGFFAKWLDSFHVYGFALVSGYLFSYLKYEKHKYNNFVPFIIGKAKRLLIPYAFISIVWVIPIGQLFYHYDVFQLVRRYGLATAPSQLWFLIMLFWCFIGAWLLARIIKNSKVLPIAIALTSYMIGFVGSIVLPNYFCILTALQYFPFFILGMKLRQNTYPSLRRIPYWLYILLDIFVFIIWITLTDYESFPFKIAAAGVQFVLNVIGALMAFFTLQLLSQKLNYKGKSIYRLLSHNQMTIYLLHQQAIYLSISLLNGVISPYLHVACNYIFSVIVSLLVGNLLLRFNATRLLVGEK